MPDSRNLTFANARMVARDRIHDGDLAVEDGRIAGLGGGPAQGVV